MDQTPTPVDLPSTEEWRTVSEHAARMGGRHLRELFAEDPGRGSRMVAGAGELDQKIDIARIEGQVKASSVKRVAEFVDKHPEESVSILRSWLHESA